MRLPCVSYKNNVYYISDQNRKLITIRDFIVKTQPCTTKTISDNNKK